MTFKRIVLVLLLLETAIVIVSWLQYGLSLEALQTATRFSGRLSLFLFSLIFILYPRPKIIQQWLSPQYYSLFAVVHGIHLAVLLMYITQSNADLIPLRLAGGAMAYVFIFAMPVLQRYSETGRLSANRFRNIQSIYAYYLWFIFFMTYLPRVQGKLPQAGGSYPEHVALLGWVSTLLGYKLSSMLFITKRQRAER